MATNLEVIEQCYLQLWQMQKSAVLWKDDENIIFFYDLMVKHLNAEIHGNLALCPTEKNEKEIRSLIARYVIGMKERGVVWAGAIPILENKIVVLGRQRTEQSKAYLRQYVDLLDDFYALASFRSFKHFCFYMESGWDKKVFQPQEKNFEGWFFYAGKMVLDRKIQFIEKQMATGRGKSLSDNFFIPWIFGIRPTDVQIGKVFGNKYNCTNCIETITSLMCDKKYAKVFPYYAKFNCKKDEMFATLKTKDGEFKIRGSNKPTSFLTVGKESKISGVRFTFLFLDDITQAEDKAKIKSHNTDIDTYNNVWSRRKYSNNDFFVIAGGTAYSIYDLLSYLKNKFGFSTAVPSKFKYTKVAKSDEIVSGGTSVFITVPALDYETDESTYPEEFPTEQLRKMRLNDYETFMAMEQQLPQKPKDSPFYITELREYTTLPEKGKNGRSDSCWAYLDGKRKGADYCAMPICTPIEDDHFLIDVFYQNKPMQDCYSGIISKIRQHHITRLYIENNINEGLKTLLERMLAEQKITYCHIEEVFNYVKKDVRISNAEADIKARIVFPEYGMYANSSQVGQALNELYTYSYVLKNEHDDFTDALAGYVECFVAKKGVENTISIFYR